MSDDQLLKKDLHRMSFYCFPPPNVVYCYLKYLWSSVNHNAEHCDQVNSSGCWHILYSCYSDYELFNQCIQQAT